MDSLSIKDEVGDKTHFRSMDKFRANIKNLTDLKQQLKKSSHEFKSPHFGLVFHPEDVEKSVKWYKQQFGRDVMPLVGGTGQADEDPMKAHQDDWRIRIGWFDVNSEERVGEPDWYDPDFEKQFMITSMTGPKPDISESETPDIVVPDG